MRRFLMTVVLAATAVGMSTSSTALAMKPDVPSERRVAANHLLTKGLTVQPAGKFVNGRFMVADFRVPTKPLKPTFDKATKPPPQGPFNKGGGGKGGGGGSVPPKPGPGGPKFRR